MQKLLRPIWKHRHLLYRITKGTHAALGRFWRWLPLPEAIRHITEDLYFLCCDEFIVKTDSYRTWRSKRMGRSRIHALLGTDLSHEEVTPLPPMQAPAAEDWDALSPPEQYETPLVDVIVPVYDGRDDTLRCLYSVITSGNTTPYELIVIDDCGPDASLRHALRDLAARDFFTLVENDGNQGFVASVNRGMQLHEDRDVVLLNADTEVYGNWLDRLYAHKDAENIGSVTPFSNNATICSYPYFARDNIQALEIPPAELDAIAARVNAGESCSIPTAVGFCMLIPRSCLNKIGYFDADTFGKGYGEENDFCMRAAKAGYTHLLAGDVYVRHAGGSSFGAEKDTRVAKAQKLLKKRWPTYPKLVRQFVLSDPPKHMRRNIDMARLEARKHKNNILMVSHALGGGTEKHIRERITWLATEEKTGAFQLAPVTGEEGMVTLSHPEVPDTPNAVFSLTHEQPQLLAALKQLGITRMHIHHVIQFPEGITDFIMMLSRQMGIAYEVMLHDYYTVCPRINLVRDEVYCGEPDISECELCIQSSFSYAGDTPVWLWRERFRTFLSHASAVRAPDADVVKRLLRYFPEISIQAEPHREDLSAHPHLGRAYEKGDTLKVAVLGAISPIKGAKVLEGMVKDAAKRNLPVEFVLIGYTGYAPLNGLREKLTITGEYKDDELEPLLTQHQPHLLLIPSVWPETYCYTLSHGFRYGIWPVVFDLGAQAARVARQNFGTVLPLEMADTPEKINDTLLALELDTGENEAPLSSNFG